jgi:putative endonuclease
LAAAYLAERGGTIVGRNVRAGRGEIDVVMRIGSQLVAVEVKTRVAGDPRPAYTAEKADHVWEAVRLLKPRPSRVDLVTVELTARGAAIRWMPGVR